MTKKEELEQVKKDLQVEIKNLDILTSKTLRDTGFIPHNFRANKGKMVNKLEEVEAKLKLLDEKTFVKKEVKKEIPNKTTTNKKSSFKTTEE